MAYLPSDSLERPERKPNLCLPETSGAFLCELKKLWDCTDGSVLPCWDEWTSSSELYITLFKHVMKTKFIVLKELLENWIKKQWKRYLATGFIIGCVYIFCLVICTGFMKAFFIHCSHTHMHTNNHQDKILADSNYILQCTPCRCCFLLNSVLLGPKSAIHSV